MEGKEGYYLGYASAEITSVKVYDKYAKTLGIQGKIDSCENESLVGQSFFDSIKVEKYYGSKEKSFAKLLHERKILSFSDEVRERGLTAIIEQIKRSIGAVESLVGQRVSVLISGYERKKGKYEPRPEDGVTIDTPGGDRKVHLSQIVIGDYDSNVEGGELASGAENGGYSDSEEDSSDVPF